MAKKIHKDQIYIQGLLTNDREIINEIYRLYADKVKRYVLANSGTIADAADIFQETLIDLYQQAKYKNLQLTCPFEPFLILVCKRKWLNHLKKKSNRMVTNQEENVLYNIGEDTFKEAEMVEKNRAEMDIYLKALDEMDEKCRTLIKETLSGEPQAEVAKRLNITYGFLRKKKSKCIASLIKLVKAKIDSDEIYH